MLLTVKEMEVLCIFHAGSLPATLEALQSSLTGSQPNPRLSDIKSLIEKLSRMTVGDVACLAFEVKK